MNNQNKIANLNQTFSTTKNLKKQKPILENKKDEDKFETVLFSEPTIERKAEGGLRTKGYFKHCLPKQPLVTVITVVFNGEKYLEDAILSVLHQTYDNIEYIIIDGDSTDGTLEIIKKYDHAIDYWISEKDQGIYDAMNKGIILSAGSIIGIVNSDDIIYSHTISNVVSAFKQKPKAKFTFGKVELAAENGQVYGISNSLPNKTIKDFSSDISMPFPHSSIYVKIELYKFIGLYDLNYKLSADYDFTIKLIKQKITNVELVQPVGFFRRGGKSGGLKTWLETKQVLLENGIWTKANYRIIAASILKAFLVRALPLKTLTFLQKFRKKTKSIYY